MTSSANEEFADVWNRWQAGGGTTVGLAKHLNCHIRALYNRRARVEKALGVKLPTMTGNPTVAKRIALQTQLGALRGDSPEHGLTNPLAPGFTLGGYSKMVKDEGGGITWYKARQDPAQREELVRAMLAAFGDDLPRVEPRKAAGTYLTDVMTAYPIGDAHIGMRSWHEETGGDWDLAIAERVQCGAMALLVDEMPATETALIANLGDWFHYDSMIPMTMRSGHVLDADGRYAKMIRVGILVMRQCIEAALAKHKTVRVVNVIGNHDETGALWLSVLLSILYQNEPRVAVETSPALFSYVEFGKTLIGLHHGHTCKPNALPAVMAADQPEAWGRTTYRYWYLGHVHHQSVFEFPGCVVETFNTLAAKDAYATAGGWRSRENMKAILLHKEHGEVGRNTVCPAMLENAA